MTDDELKDALRRLADSGVVLDKDDVAELREALDLYRGFKAMGVIGSALKRMIIWIGIVAGGIVAFKAGLVDWLTVR